VTLLQAPDERKRLHGTALPSGLEVLRLVSLTDGALPSRRRSGVSVG